MLCQSCGKRPANTHIKTIINGELTEHSLCSECAQKMGYGNSFFPSKTFDQFFSSFFGKNSLMGDTLRCPVCGASLSDISDTGKVGCADCYKTFLNQLMPSIQRMHGNTHHIGKIPMGTALQVVEQTEEKEPPKEKSEIEQYQEQLQTAIDEQNFELAAELRDKIKALSEKSE